MLVYKKQIVLMGACLVWLGAVLIHEVFFYAWPDVLVPDGEVVLTGTVQETLGANDGRQRVRLADVVMTFGRSEEAAALPKRVDVRVLAYPRLRVGDQVRVGCRAKAVVKDTSGSFRYDRFFVKEQVSVTCEGYDEPRVVGHTATIQSRLFAVRDRLTALIGRHLVEPHASLLTGLLYGSVSTMPEKVQEQFRATGTAHIVAVSGYNVTLVASVLFWLLTATVLKRQRAFYVVSMGIVLFVVLAGGDPGVVRAGIMGWLLLLARQIGRPKQSGVLLLLAATVMTAINPHVLLDDVGFQLSFAAAAGLLWLAPWIKTRAPFVTQWCHLRTILSETLAATVATLPIVLLRFQTLVPVAVVANVFVVPAVPVAMLTGVLGSAGAGVAEAIGLAQAGVYLLLPSYVVLEWILVLTSVCSRVPSIVW